MNGIEPDSQHSADLQLRAMLLELSLVLRHRLHWILICLALGLGLAAWINVATEPRYEAVARVLVDDARPRMPSADEGSSRYANNVTVANTHSHLLESFGVARKVVAELDLLTREGSEYAEEELVRHPERLRHRNSPQVRESLDEAAALLRERVLAEPLEYTKLIKVSYSGRNPEEAVQIVNRLVDVYIREDEERRNMDSLFAIKWLEETVPKYGAQLDKAEKALLDFQEKHGITTGKREAERHILEIPLLRQELANTRLRRLDVQNQWERIERHEASKPQDYLLLSFVAGHDAVSELRRQLLDLEVSRVRHARSLGPNHDRMRALREQVAAVSTALDVEIQRLIDSVREDYKTLLAREAKLKDELERKMAEATEFNRMSVQLERRQREVDKVRQLYDPLVQRLGEFELISSIQPRIFHAVDPAREAEQVAPRPLRNLITGGLLGLLMGVALAYLSHRVDDRVRSPEDLAAAALPIAGTIPAIPRLTEVGASPLVAHAAPSTPPTEAFRALRTNVLLQGRRGDSEHGRVLLVTSPGESEGKSLVSSNLSIVMAQARLRTLLIDADMRRPKIDSLFRVSNEAGASSLLSAEVTLDQARVRSGIAGLDLLPSGPLPAQPAELLESGALRQLMDDLRRQYDWIVLDSPPLLAVTDAMILSHLSDGVLLVGRADATSRRALEQARELLNAANARLYGVVVNGVQSSNPSYYYTYGSVPVET